MSLAKIRHFSLFQIISKSINYLLSLVYGNVIPTDDAGNIGPHSVVSRKEEILSPGANCSFVWSKLPLLQCKMVGILPFGPRKTPPQGAICSTAGDKFLLFLNDPLWLSGSEPR